MRTQNPVSLDDFTKHYIICALWSSTDDDGEPLGNKYSINYIADETVERMRADCDRFRAENAADIATAVSPKPGEWSADEQVAHDFWLTRNGHGSGFWDNYNGIPYSEEVGDRLTKSAQKFGTFDLYIGDDGEIYGS